MKNRMSFSLLVYFMYLAYLFIKLIFSNELLKRNYYFYYSS